MKNALRIHTAVLTILSISGCATSFPVGSVYTDLTLPNRVTSASGGSKTGIAECSSILTLYATGDCSISAAKAEGGITTVTAVDWKAHNVLGVYGTYTLTVTGE